MSRREPRAAVVVMAKSPQPGRVKTRLCPPCTPAEAATLAAAALADTLAAVEALPQIRPVVALDGPVGPWLPRAFDVVPQVAGDLGTRLAAATTTVGGPMLVVGMDTPQLDTALLDNALRALLAPGVDAVLGPATDGGYWAIGLDSPTGCEFDDVPMSTDHTGAAQLARLSALGLRVGSLTVQRDVDTFADALAVAVAAPATRFAAAVRALAVAVAVPA